MSSNNPAWQIAKEALSCWICSAGVKEYLAVYDDRYGYPGLFEIIYLVHIGVVAI
jgi:hypothetical protein